LSASADLRNVAAVSKLASVGTARFEEAVSAYREALRENIRERAPLNWASAQLNLGDAPKLLGERERAPKLDSSKRSRPMVRRLRNVTASAPLPWA
jgi:hypothetical protein